VPKQIFKIDQFHGGLNTNSDPRDIADNELSEATDIMVDEVGRIRLMGGTTAHDAPAQATTYPSGYGLFQFSHDRKLDSLLITTSGVHGLSTSVIGKWLSNADDASVASTSVGILYEIPSTTTLIISKHQTGSGGGANPWSTSDDIYIADTFGAGAGDTTVIGSGGYGNSVTVHSGTSPTISTPETGEDYLVLADTDNGELDIYDSTGDIWQAGVINYGSTAAAKLAFYVVDGTLRVSDGNFNNTNKWYGYIKRTHFDGLLPGGTADTYDAWFSKDQSIAAPTRGLWGGQIKGTCEDPGDTTTALIHNTTDTNPFGIDSTATLLAGTDMAAELNSGVYIAVQDDNDEARLISSRTSNVKLVTGTFSNSWADLQYRIFPPAGTGFCMNLDMNNGGGTFVEDKYQYAQTFIYDGGQESLPAIMAGDNAQNPVGDNDSIEVEIFCTSPFDPRIIGGRIYQRKHPTLNTTGTGREPFSLFVDISLKDGVRENLDDSYSAWEIEDGTGSGGPGTDVYMKNKDLEVLNLNALTYETINGYSPDEVTLDCQFKTAVIANRRAYVGNIKTKSDDGEDVVLGDAMIKSPVNKFDVFPLGRIIKASVRDGDSIIKLEEYADRILQFKKNKMHLINISQEIEFLEDTFMHKGVSHPAATCKTDFGIAWVNRLGVYMYDGQRVHNLFEKEGRLVIKPSEWEAWFSAGDEPMIGYFPKKRQLIIRNDVDDGADDGNVYIHDMVTKSWVTGIDIIPSDDDTAVVTNFINDWNGDLVLAYNTAGTIAKWDDATDTTAMLSMVTKDIDFGHPGVRKKIYKVYITYRGNATNVEVHYGVDGLSPTLTFNDITSGTDGSSTGSGSNAKSISYDAGVTDWLKAELKPSASINNISSFRLKISADGSNAIHADFEINDISIVYRLKNVR